MEQAVVVGGYHQVSVDVIGAYVHAGLYCEREVQADLAVEEETDSQISGHGNAYAWTFGERKSVTGKDAALVVSRISAQEACPRVQFYAEELVVFVYEAVVMGV